MFGCSPASDAALALLNCKSGMERPVADGRDVDRLEAAVSADSVEVASGAARSSAPPVGRCRYRLDRGRGRGRVRSEPSSSFLEDRECLGKTSHEVTPSEYRRVCVLTPDQQFAGGVPTDQSRSGIFKPRAFARRSTCAGQRNSSINTSSRAAKREQLHRGFHLITPAAHGAAGGERITGDDATVLQRLLA